MTNNKNADIMENTENQKLNLGEFNLEDLKKFISDVKDFHKSEKTFVPERLKNLREEKPIKNYNAGLSA